MATRLWRGPLGAEADATWSLDSEDSGFEKMESGLNATPVDYARFGQLFLHDGEWNGTRIVSKDWVREATTTDTSDAPAGNYYFADNYQYFWWIDTVRPGRFYALGNFGQYIYVAPDAGMSCNGADWGVDNDTWVGLFRDIADRSRSVVITEHLDRGYKVDSGSRSGRRRCLRDQDACRRAPVVLTNADRELVRRHLELHLERLEERLVTQRRVAAIERILADSGGPT